MQGCSWEPLCQTQGDESQLCGCSSLPWCTKGALKIGAALTADRCEFGAAARGHTRTQHYHHHHALKGLHNKRPRECCERRSLTTAVLVRWWNCTFLMDSQGLGFLHHATWGTSKCISPPSFSTPRPTSPRPLDWSLTMAASLAWGEQKCLSSVYIRNVGETLTAAVLNAEQHCPHQALTPYHCGFNLCSLREVKLKKKAAVKPLEHS